MGFSLVQKIKVLKVLLFKILFSFLSDSEKENHFPTTHNQIERMADDDDDGMNMGDDMNMGAPDHPEVYGLPMTSIETHLV